MGKRFVEHRVRKQDLAKPGVPVLGLKVEPPGAKPSARASVAPPGSQREIGGPEGPEPTRFGDWERKGICVDF
jgi:hypothetical protein